MTAATRPKLWNCRPKTPLGYDGGVAAIYAQALPPDQAAPFWQVVEARAAEGSS